MCYGYFILPKESKVLDFTNEDSLLKFIEEKLEILKWEKNKYDKANGTLANIRRIRNAVAHGKIKFANNNIYFEDGRNSVVYESFMDISNFHDFLKLCMKCWNKQHS